MIANTPPTIVPGSIPTNVTLYERDPDITRKKHQYTVTSLCTDLEESTLTYQLYINGAVKNEGELTGDFGYLNGVFSFDFTDKTNAGFYEIVLSCSDGINFPSTYAYYNINAIKNDPPVYKYEIPDIYVSIFNYSLGNVSVGNYLIDPESKLLPAGPFQIGSVEPAIGHTFLNYDV